MVFFPFLHMDIGRNSAVASSLSGSWASQSLSSSHLLLSPHNWNFGYNTQRLEYCSSQIWFIFGVSGTSLTVGIWTCDPCPVSCCRQYFRVQSNSRCSISPLFLTHNQMEFHVCADCLNLGTVEVLGPESSFAASQDGPSEVPRMVLLTLLSLEFQSSQPIWLTLHLSSLIYLWSSVNTLHFC